MATRRFNVVTAGLVTAEELDIVFAKLLSSPGWSPWKAKTSHRLFDQWAYHQDRSTPPPPQLRFLGPLMQSVFDAMQQDTPCDPIVPFQCFVCLYETGNDSCPAHSHDCRQLTLSLGAARTFVAGDETLMLSHGDAIILDGERHSLPPSHTKGPRASINVFYSTQDDLNKRPVSVNHNPRSGYPSSATKRDEMAGEDQRAHNARSSELSRNDQRRKRRWRANAASSVAIAESQVAAHVVASSISEQPPACGEVIDLDA